MAMCMHLQDGQQLSSPVKFDLPVISGSLPPVQVRCIHSDDGVCCGTDMYILCVYRKVTL